MACIVTHVSASRRPNVVLEAGGHPLSKHYSCMAATMPLSCAAQFGVLVGSVQYTQPTPPQPPGVAAENGSAITQADLSTALMKAGLARVRNNIPTN